MMQKLITLLPLVHSLTINYDRLPFSPGVLQPLGADLIPVSNPDAFKEMIIDNIDRLIENENEHVKENMLHALKAFYLSPNRDYTSVSERWYQVYTDYIARDGISGVIPEETQNRGIPSNRFFNCPNCWAVFNFDAIWGYGCYCVFADDVYALNYGKTVGKHVDEIDKICRDLHLCYRCAEMDERSDRNQKCDAFSIVYDFQVQYDVIFNDPPPVGLNMHCQDTPDTCEHRACSCDAGFIYKLLTTDIPPLYNSDNKHSAGFDHADNCHPTDVGIAAGCCGDYPDRFPYNDQGSTRCCNDKTIYNSDYLQCCSDGSVIGFGGSC